MKFLFLSSLFCFLVAVSRAATSQGFYSNPMYPDKCVVQGVIFSPGEKVKLPNRCGIMICGAKSSVVILSCGIANPPLAHKISKTSKTRKSDEPYPECCFK